MWRKCGGSHEESLETLENQEVTIEMKLGIVRYTPGFVIL